MASREEEYIRRMRARGYVPTLAGMDDDDIEYELSKMEEGERRREAPTQPLNPAYRPVDPGLKARILRMFGQPHDENAIPKGQKFYLNGWDNWDENDTLVKKDWRVEPAPLRDGTVGAEEYDPWTKAWKLDWGKEGRPAEQARTMEWRWGRNEPGLVSRGGVDRPLSYAAGGHDVGTGGYETNGADANPYAGGYANGGAEGDMLFEVTGVKPMEEGKKTAPEPPADVKLWAEENPDWNNLQPQMKSTTTSFVGEVNKEFGTEKTPWITSGYRSPELNATLPEASPNSWHLEGLAVDINLDDYTAEERAKIEEMARKRFGEVYWHRGTGWHLHIGNPQESRGD